MGKQQMGPSLCPDCYLFDGMDIPLIVRQGSTLKCQRGHSWQGNDHISDMEILEQRQNLARHKRSEMEKKEHPELEEAIKVVPAVVNNNTGMEVMIDKENRERISNLMGPFEDASTLYGSIFSVIQDMKNIQSELSAMKNAKAPAALHDLNTNMHVSGSGDMAVTIIVPERHVEALKIISESQGISIPEYMNAIVGNGLDSNWFF